MPTRYQPLALTAALVGQLVLVVVLIISPIHRINRGETGDFVHFYYAGDAVWHGRDPYAAYTHGYIYPPLLSFLIQPVSRLPIRTAATIMLVVNVTITLITAAIAAMEFFRRFNIPRQTWAILSVMFWGILLNVDKVKGEWQMWQTDVFMLLLFTLGLIWLEKRPWAAGIALGLAVNLKYLPLLFLPWMLLRRRFEAARWLVIGSVLWAILPAVQVGWKINARDWRTAIAGLINMTEDTRKSATAADIHGITDSLSCSITSALARGASRHGPAWIGFVAAFMLGLAMLGIARQMYRRAGQPVIGEMNSPAVIAGEWCAMIAAMLAFSPQTNTRHLYDATLLTVAGVSLFFIGRSTVRSWPVALGLAILAAGFSLPPGSRTVVGEPTLAASWLRAGGPCGCLLVAAMLLLGATLEVSEISMTKAEISLR